MGVIKYFHKKSPKDKIKEIDAPTKGCWIDVHNPNVDDTKFLLENFDLDEQNLISSTDKYELPRVEFEEEGMYVIVKIINPDNKKEVHTMMMVLTDKYFFTVSKSHLRFYRDIVEDKIDFSTNDKVKFLLYMISRINRGFERETQIIVRKVKQMKEKATHLSQKDLSLLLEEEATLNELVSSYQYMNSVYHRIMKSKRFTEEDKDVLEDLIIDAREGLDLCKFSLKTISNIRTHYEIILSNNLNKIITLLTISTIFISIPAAISGLYGMNIDLPFAENRHVFFYLFGVIVILWLAFLALMKKKKVI